MLLRKSLVNGNNCLSEVDHSSQRISVKSQARQLMPVIPALRIVREEVCCELEACQPTQQDGVSGVSRKDKIKNKQSISIGILNTPVMSPFAI